MTIIKNTARGYGGGVFFSSDPQTIITNSALKNNCAKFAATDSYESPDQPKFDKKTIVTNCKGQVVISGGKKSRTKLYIIAGGVLGLLILGTIILTWFLVSRKQKKKVRELEERERIISERERRPLNGSVDGYGSIQLSGSNHHWGTPQGSSNHSGPYSPPENYSNSSLIVPEELKLTPSLLEIDFRDRLGRGGSAIVYRGRYNGKDVAIKHLQQTVSSDQLEKEMMVWFKIRHPNLVALIGVTPPPNFFMVMELMECSLQLFLANIEHELAWADRMSFVRDISRGLNHLHQEGLIHRDLKAANILLSRTLPRTAKLADFGLARELREAGEGSVDTVHYRAGTFGWMAPELFENKKPTKATDIYGFAMICYEILCLKEPWKNLPPASVVRELTQLRRPPIPADLVPVPPVSFVNLINHCWSQNPEDRPSADSVITAIDYIITNELDWNMDGDVSTWLNLAGLDQHVEAFVNMRIHAARQISHLRGAELARFMTQAGISSEESQQKFFAALRRHLPATGSTSHTV